MPTVIHRQAGAWMLCSPAAGKRQQHARTLAGMDTRADVEQLIREELALVGRETVAAALRQFSVTPDGWQPDTLGAAIRQARKRAGLTGDQAAGRLGLTSNNWRAWEADDVEPLAGRLFAIAAALGVSADALRPYAAAPSTDSAVSPRPPGRAVTAADSSAGRPRRNRSAAAPAAPRANPRRRPRK